MSERKRVSLEKAPVRETALAIEFIAPPGFGVTEIVHLADRWSQEFGIRQEHPVLPPADLAPDAVAGRYDPFTGVRLWLENPREGLLIQIQFDRLVLNWRANPPGHETRLQYPGFDSLLPKIDALWRDLLSFLEERESTPPQPHLVEFAYVNRISAAEEIPITRALSILNPTDELLPGREQSCGYRTERITEDGGVVALTAQHSENADEWGLIISARMPLQPAERPTGALERAHDVAFQAFQGVTSAAAKEVWAGEGNGTQ